MEVLRLKPAIKDYIWGGTSLLEWGKDAMGKECIAECWELSLHNDGLTLVDSGEHCGKTLKQVLELWGSKALGERAKQFKKFPQLIKLIDSAQALSIQVHPSDSYALKHEGQYGKTEVWYIINAQEGAGVYWGFKQEVTSQAFKDAILNGTVCSLLNFVPVQKGDVLFIDAGTVHAICQGITLAEIQQNSNITYRIFDYNRVGADGARPLHIDKAVAVSVPLPPTRGVLRQTGGEGVREIASCKYFTAYEHITSKPVLLQATDSFNAVLFIEGGGTINGLSYSRGQTFFVPANTQYQITPNTPSTFLLSKV